MRRKISLVTALLMAALIISSIMCLSGCGIFDSSAGFNVYVKSEGEGVAGVSVQLCDDSVCMTAETDENGVAVFDTKPGEYTAHIMSVPEGYTNDPGREYTGGPGATSIQIILSKAPSVSSQPTSAAAGENPTFGENQPSGENATSGENQPSFGGLTVVETDESSATAEDDFWDAEANYDYQEGTSMYAPLTFTTMDLDNNPVNESIFSPYDVTVVNVFASWCPPCMYEMPEFAETYKELNDKGVGFVGFALFQGETLSDVEQAVEETGVTYPVLYLCPEVDRLLPGAIPCTFFVDRNGNILDITQDERIAVMGHSDDGGFPGGICGSIDKNTLYQFIANRMAR